MAEVREAAAATLGGNGTALALWGASPSRGLRCRAPRTQAGPPLPSLHGQALIPRSRVPCSLTAHRQPMHTDD